ncbi:hypothetical protein EYF80_037777 [Liparis tanakae]|uniref:Uncharacterized protein n=1 Tax=Liparis tanakae TaxID=230148 RepID=A0A4Z2GGJ8_9TELE|nr:hypothetical protein EYF80_037777 [Liparis tanakae]
MSAVASEISREQRDATANSALGWRRLAMRLLSFDNFMIDGPISHGNTQEVTRLSMRTSSYR